jgi:hypothetical protein
MPSQRAEESKKKRDRRIKLEVVTLIVTIILSIIQWVKPQRVVVVDNIKQRDEVENQTTPESGLPVTIIDENLSPLTFEQFRKIYDDDSLTAVQHDDFVKKQMGKRVVWEGKVVSVEESERYFEQGGTIEVIIEGLDNAYYKIECLFDEKHKKELLKLNKGEYV